MVMFDASFGSPLTSKKVASIARAAAVETPPPPRRASSSFWVLGNALADTRRDLRAAYQESRHARSRRSIADRKRFIEGDRQQRQGVMDGILVAEAAHDSPTRRHLEDASAPGRRA